MFRVLTGETMPEERFGTLRIPTPTHARPHRKPNSYPCANTSRTHRKHIVHASHAHLSPIDNTSIEHDFILLSLITLLPLSFMFEIKEENYALPPFERWRQTHPNVVILILYLST